MSEFLDAGSVKRAKEGERVAIRGWIYTLSSLGKVLFVRLRDQGGIVQIVAKQDNLSDETIETLKGLGRESSVIVRGIVRKDKRAPGGTEILMDDLFVISRAPKDYPIRKGASATLVADLRHLYLRSQRMTAVMRVRSDALRLFREFFLSEGFCDFNCPTIITAAVEGGATLFNLNYYNRKAYLTQSSQFYLEAGIFAHGKVFTIQPSFRAERSKTPKHLTEYWHLEAEEAWVDNEGMMDLEERMLEYVSNRITERSGREIRMFNPNYAPLKRPFKRVRYADAMSVIGRSDRADLGADEEKAAMSALGSPLFITHFPKELRALYHKPDPHDEQIVLCHDLLLWPLGEVIGGGQRSDSYEQLLSRITAEGFNPEDYKWYLDLRRYGSVPHSGFGLGIERFLGWVLKLPHIRYAIPFPRTMTRVYP